MAEDLVPLTLVPVEVFGGEPDDDTWGYGLCDAVPAWSDCNRANGRIYRVDDTDPQYRKPGHTVTVYARREDLPWFELKFGEEHPNGHE